VGLGADLCVDLQARSLLVHLELVSDFIVFFNKRAFLIKNSIQMQIIEVFVQLLKLANFVSVVASFSIHTVTIVPELTALLGLKVLDFFRKLILAVSIKTVCTVDALASLDPALAHLKLQVLSLSCPIINIRGNRSVSIRSCFLVL